MKKIILTAALISLNTLTCFGAQSSVKTMADIVPLGMGAMQMSFSPYSQDEKVSRIVATIRLLLTYSKGNQKVLINTAHIYGMQMGDNERLLKETLLNLTSAERSKLIVITWVGLAQITIETEQDDHALVGPESIYSKDMYAQFIDGSYKNLAMDTLSEIEFWVGLHRINPHVSLSTQMEQLALIQDNPRVTKVGLSEASLEALKECNKYLTVSFLETEMSLSRQFVVRENILEYCKTHNILLLAYSPLDRGIWTSRVDAVDQWLTIGKQHPFLAMLPGWADETIVRANYKQRSIATAIAKKYNLELNELALAWIMLKGAVPIPDSTSPERSISNFNAINAMKLLSEEDIRILDSIDFQGKRYK